MSSRVGQPFAKILSGEWNSHHQPILNDGGWWDVRGRRVYLVADSHVAQHAPGQIASANDAFPDPNLTVGGTRGFDVQ